jgi:Ser/Thr protein kinase RdoA (MazF antagonist)
MVLTEIISTNYELEIKNIKCIDEHFGTEIYLIEASSGQYLLKTFHLDRENTENEGRITEYLHTNGIPVAKFLKTIDGNYMTKTAKMQFHIQEFIKGETLAVNTAPEWYLEKSAQMLGKIQRVLKDYSKLPTEFDDGFFQKTVALDSKQFYTTKLVNAVETKDKQLQQEIEEKLKHIERVSAFSFDSSKLTYANSHGDYYTGQIIVNNRDMVVIDWSSASYLPACFEVFMSYTYADPLCRNGRISAQKFKKYLNEYLKHSSIILNDYDIKMMPYFLYYYLCFCSFTPPYSEVPGTYKAINTLSNNLMNWLYENVDNISTELSVG